MKIPCVSCVPSCHRRRDSHGDPVTALSLRALILVGIISLRALLKRYYRHSSSSIGDCIKGVVKNVLGPARLNRVARLELVARILYILMKMIY